MTRFITIFLEGDSIELTSYPVKIFRIRGRCIHMSASRSALIMFLLVIIPFDLQHISLAEEASSARLTTTMGRERRVPGATTAVGRSPNSHPNPLITLVDVKHLILSPAQAD